VSATASIAFARDEYVVSLQASGKRPKTLVTYEWALRGFIDFTGPQRDLGEALTAGNIERWLVAMEREGKATASRHLTFRVLRSFSNWALRRGLLDVNPMSGVSAPRYDPVPKPVLTDPDIAALLRACEQDRSPQGPRDAGIVRVFLTCGLRRGEVAGLRVSDWDRARHVVRVRESKSRSGRREVYLPVATENALYRWLRERDRFCKRTGQVALGQDPDGPLFVGLRRGSGEPLDGNAIRAILVRRAREAGLDGAVYPHRLRHTFAHTALSAGVGELDVATALGHADTTLLASLYGASQKGQRSIAAFRALDRGGR
jgi:integrase